MEVDDRERRFAELRAAIDRTPGPLLASHAAETDAWSVTDGDGLEKARTGRGVEAVRCRHR